MQHEGAVLLALYFTYSHNTMFSAVPYTEVDRVPKNCTQVQVKVFVEIFTQEKVKVIVRIVT